MPPTGIQENVGEGEVDTIAVDVGPTGGKIYGPGDRDIGAEIGKPQAECAGVRS